jgi:5'-deoxynucleotidase YfbR-like HD superfamily hydrolase
MSPLRWHCHPNDALRLSGDNIDRHQEAVTQLVASLCAAIGYETDGTDILRAAQYHDEAERVLGDLPATAKERFPALAAAYAKAELEVLIEMGHTWRLSRTERRMIRLCDVLERYLYAAARGVDHPDDLAECRALAKRIGTSAVAWLNTLTDKRRDKVEEIKGGAGE